MYINVITISCWIPRYWVTYSYSYYWMSWCVRIVMCNFHINIVLLENLTLKIAHVSYRYALYVFQAFGDSFMEVSIHISNERGDELWNISLEIFRSIWRWNTEQCTLYMVTLCQPTTPLPLSKQFDRIHCSISFTVWDVMLSRNNNNNRKSIRTKSICIVWLLDLTY